MVLDDPQEALLVDLVEADRAVPRDQRQPFYIIESVGPPGVQIIHAGWRDSRRRVPLVDLETLASGGLLQAGYSGGAKTYFVTPAGFARYAQIKRVQGHPIERTQRRMRDYLEGERFRVRHPAAYGKWQEAE